MPQTPPSADELRPIKEQAVNFIRFAREQNATNLTAEVSVDDGAPFKFVVKRSEIYAPSGGTDTDSHVTGHNEHITVKRGRSSAQSVLFAGPAAWLEA